MNKIFAFAFAMLAFAFAAALSTEAYGYDMGYYQGGYYDSHHRYDYPDYNVYNNRPARVGGRFGANSAYIINLRPGVYTPVPYNPCTNYGACNTRYARAGGWFGGGYYGGLRPGYYGATGAGYRSSPIFHGPI